jgi:hypothetical protein
VVWAASVASVASVVAWVGIKWDGAIKLKAKVPFALQFVPKFL